MRGRANCKKKGGHEAALTLSTPGNQTMLTVVELVEDFSVSYCIGLGIPNRPARLQYLATVFWVTVTWSVEKGYIMFEAFTMLRALHFVEGKELKMKMRERAARCCPVTAQSRPGKPIPLSGFFKSYLL